MTTIVFPQAESLDGALCIPDIKLHSNPSAFNVYCNVRHCVLDWQQREASLALASRSSVQSGDSDSEEEEEYREPAVKLPKVCDDSHIGWLKVVVECDSKSRVSLFYFSRDTHSFVSLGQHSRFFIFIVVL